MMSNFKDIIKEFDNIITNINNLKDKKSDVLNNILNYAFPIGKYKDKCIIDIINTDFNYCYNYIIDNYPEISDNTVEKYKLPYLLKSIKESIDRSVSDAKNDEYENNRLEYCKKHNIDYNLDYNIRHNRNLRDFGM